MDSTKWLGGKVHVRCRSKHQHRAVLNQPPHWYKRERKCWCGKPYRVDQYRTQRKEHTAREFCHCDGVDGYFVKLNVEAESTRSTVHQYGSNGCIHRDEYLEQKQEQILNGKLPKHSPLRVGYRKLKDKEVPF